MVDSASESKTPIVSVVVPLMDARGDALATLASWTHGQSCPPTDFEIVLVSPTTDPELEREAAKLLRPHDRLVHQPDAEEMGLYEAGGAAARGDVVLFTENHVFAHSDTVVAVARHFQDRPDRACATLSTRHSNPTRIARMEQDLFESSLPNWSDPQNPERVQFRAFAVRRSVYESVGGVRSRWAFFGPAELGARLYSAGYAVDRLEHVFITHVNTPNLREQYRHIRKYVFGEFAFRAESDPDYCERFFGHAIEWENRRLHSTPVARSVCKALFAAIIARRSLNGWLQLFSALFSELPRWLSAAIWGPNGAIRRADWTVNWWTAAASTPLLPYRWRFAAYVMAWKSVARHARLVQAQRHLTAEDAYAEGGFRSPDPDGVEIKQIGFHGRETWNGRPFRWSQPVSLLRFAMPPGDYQITVDTQNLAGPAGSSLLGLIWSGRPIPLSRVRFDTASFTFQIPARWMKGRTRHDLVLLARAHTSAADPRRLGLPVFSVDVRRLRADNPHCAPAEPSKELAAA